MSEFDKEKEREKLRKKLERDEEKRKETRRMSELLLRGATMTNQHCDRCGDPIFRYDGQEFCPSCQATRSTEEVASEDGDGGEDAVTIDPESPGSETEATAEDDRSGTVETDRGNEADARSIDETGPDRSETEGSSEAARTADTATSRDHTREPIADPAQESISDPVPDSVDRRGETGDLSAARASLARSVERFAARAEKTDDPRRAKDYLAAAREAAEALEALR